MPNWCYNKLTLEHSNPEMIQRAVKAYNESKLCSEFYPEPDYNKTKVYPTFPDIVKNNKPVNSKSAWWDWRVQNWGTKWDVGVEEGILEVAKNSKIIQLDFDSAWSPPIGLMKKMEELGFKVLLYYWEPGIGFSGKYSNGIDELYDGNPSLKIDSVFNISESLKEWEEE